MTSSEKRWLMMHRNHSCHKKKKYISENFGTELLPALYTPTSGEFSPYRDSGSLCAIPIFEECLHVLVLCKVLHRSSLAPPIYLYADI